MFELNNVAEQAAHREAQRMAHDAKQPAGEILLETPLISGDFDNAGILSNQIKKRLQSMGIEPEVVRRAAIACYEMETNIIIHTLGGKMSAWIEEGRIVLESVDEGPGIPDIEKAMSPGYSTASDKVRTMGFGAGMGLPNIKKCSDRFEITTEMGKGTKLHIEIDLKFVEKKDDTLPNPWTEKKP